MVDIKARGMSCFKLDSFLEFLATVEMILWKGRCDWSRECHVALSIYLRGLSEKVGKWIEWVREIGGRFHLRRRRLNFWRQHQFSLAHNRLRTVSRLSWGWRGMPATLWLVYYRKTELCLFISGEVVTRVYEHIFYVQWFTKNTHENNGVWNSLQWRSQLGAGVQVADNPHRSNERRGVRGRARLCTCSLTSSLSPYVKVSGHVQLLPGGQICASFTFVHSTFLKYYYQCYALYYILMSITGIQDE